jgi:S1-C subfamily serine protease
VNILDLVLGRLGAWDDERAVNVLDLILLALVVLAAISGFRRGALMQVLSYGGLVVGLVLGAILAPSVASLVHGDAAQAGVAVAVVLGAAGIGNAAGWLAGTWVRARMRRTRLGTADAAGGSVISTVAVVVAIWFLAFNLVNGPFPALSGEIRGSVVVRAIERAMPAPPSLFGDVRHFFDRFGFPEVFTGLPPAPAGPVQWPTDAEAQRAFSAAQGSMVRIVGQACGEIQSGSGFAIAPHDVVTNAHVVAGVGIPQVQQQNGGSQAATVVLFDARTDLAVLRVPGALGPPLSFAPGELDRGAGGAVLGFPGGGDLKGEPAAVRRPLNAIGRDIYGDRTVVREVYELQATVQPGDSGGPFVLPDGRVAGIVFAASTTDEGVGYAVQSSAATHDIRSAIPLTTAVSTGRCIA